MNALKYYTRTTFLMLCLCLGFASPVFGQECDGAEIFTHESFLFGRFEVTMQSAPGSGIVSSFFLFNNQSGCNYPEENNEIDVEMTGNANNIHFTTHHPGNPNPWFYGENFDLGFNPHEGMHDYAIEWEPGIVRWFVDGELIYVQDEEAAMDLQYPMAIYMNIWASGAEDWVGPWNPAVLPRQSVYDQVRYFKYVPGQGDYGTNNNFKMEWEDSFESIDPERWNMSDFTEFSLNYCTYRSENIQVENGFLYLIIDDHAIDPTPVPVSFSVNVLELNLNASDKVYLNGTFNGWCGNCNPMVKNGEMWELTLGLTPGRHEYLYTVNGWDIIGAIPLNSECDFKPCDEFGNYGFVLLEASDPLVLDTYCWGACNTCQTTSTSEFKGNKDRKLIKIFDISGREVEEVPHQLLFYLYSDGTVEKRVITIF